MLDTAELAKVLKMYTEMDLGGKSTATRYAIGKLFASMDQDGSGEVDFHEVSQRETFQLPMTPSPSPSLGTSTRLPLLLKGEPLARGQLPKRRNISPLAP